MENKNRGYHVTIVDNNTGETVRDFDTNAINYVALEDTAKGKRIMEERKPTAGCGTSSSRLADGISIIQAYALLNTMQSALQELFEEHPEFQLLEKLLGTETIDLGENGGE